LSLVDVVAFVFVEVLVVPKLRFAHKLFSLRPSVSLLMLARQTNGPWHVSGHVNRPGGGT
jgi:hypothetical protein